MKFLCCRIIIFLSSEAAGWETRRESLQLWWGKWKKKVSFDENKRRRKKINWNNKNVRDIISPFWCSIKLRKLPDVKLGCVLEGHTKRIKSEEKMRERQSYGIVDTLEIWMRFLKWLSAVEYFNAADIRLNEGWGGRGRGSSNKIIRKLSRKMIYKNLIESVFEENCRRFGKTYDI